MINKDQDLLIADLARTVLENPKPNEFASFLALRTLSSLDCRGVILGRIQQEGFLDLVAAYGFGNESTEPFTRMPLWTPLPITDSARFRRTIIFNEPSEMIKEYPQLGSISMSSQGVTVSMPILSRNLVIGALGFTSLIAPADDIDDSLCTKSILSLCGIYLQIQSLVNSLENKSPARKDLLTKLSDRQIEIIKLFKDELTTTQMAKRLKFSHSTIKQDIIKIYHLFECSSRQEVLDRAYRSGIIES